MGFDPTKVPAKDAVVKIGKLSEEAAVAAFKKEENKGGGPRKSVLQALKDRLEFFRQRDEPVVVEDAVSVPKKSLVEQGIVDAPPSRFALYRDGHGIQHRCEVVRASGGLATLKVPGLDPEEPQVVTVHEGDAPGEFRWA